MAEETKPKTVTEKNISGKKAVIGLVVVMLLLLGIMGAFLYKTAPVKQSEAEASIGIIDIQLLAKKHKDYAKLEQLRAELQSLRAAAAVDNMLMISKPVTDKEGFDEMAVQKQRMASLTRHSELQQQLHAEAEKRYKELEPQYAAEQDLVNKPYLNKLLNLRIKLDNAQALGISEAEKKSMLQQMDDLQTERIEKINELRRQQKEQFQQQFNESVKDRLAELEELDKAEQNQLQGDAIKKQLEIQDRNSQEMQQALTPIQQKISKARRAAVVEMKQLEVSQLEEQIYRDIAGRAAKLAIIHHLTLILAQPAPGPSGNGLMSLPETMWQKQGIEIPVVGVKTIDLTDEMLQEMNTL